MREECQEDEAFLWCVGGGLGWAGLGWAGLGRGQLVGVWVWSLRLAFCGVLVAPFCGVLVAPFCGVLVAPFCGVLVAPSLFGFGKKPRSVGRSLFDMTRFALWSFLFWAFSVRIYIASLI